MSWTSHQNSLFSQSKSKIRRPHVMTSCSSSKILWFKWWGCTDRPRERSLVVGTVFSLCGKGKCYRLNVCVPPTPRIMLKPNPQCDNLWGWGFWEVVTSWGQSLIKEIPIAPLPLVSCEDVLRRWVSVNQGGFSPDTKSASKLVLSFPASSITSTVRNKFPLIISYPVYGI